MSARYRFLPWVRIGAGATTVDPLTASVPARATRPVKLRVNDRRDVDVTARLHGPGDVISLDTRMVVRTDPPHLASEFEPNYFPLIEFDRPDVPWMFTPATGDTRGRLRPWLSLVTVRQQPGVRIEVEASSRRPVLRIEAPARPSAELPDLAESWAWAHGQIVATETETDLEQLLAADSTQNLSRIVSPRRLEPNTSYLTCLVPAFEVGRKAGLGLPITAGDELALAPAWTVGPNASATIALPVYYHWEFSTGDAADFESLVRRLEPRSAHASASGRRLSVRQLGFGVPDLPDLTIGGALRPAGSAAAVPIRDLFETKLQTLLNLPATRLTEAGQDPVVGPPIYGSLQSARPTVPRGNHWLAQLNLDPRRRAIAGLGALVVQEQQEQLMASAWEQLGPATHQQRRVQQPAFAAAVLQRTHARLAAMEADQLLAVTAPLHARVRVAGASTLHQQVRDSRTPTLITSAAFRKAVRPHGPMLRRPGPAGAAPLRFTTHVATAGLPLFLPIPKPDMVTPKIIAGQVAKLPAPTAADRLQKHNAMKAAAAKLQTYFGKLAATQPANDRRPLITPSNVRTSLLDQLAPMQTVTAAVASTAAKPTMASELGPTLPAPSFPQPMYEALRDLDPELLLPGSDQIPADSVVALESDPAFIEAFMVGLNHEMSRELKWREYPSDERGTSFQTFWPAASSDERALRQLPPLHEWTNNSALGSHFMSGTAANLLLLVRGELFDRYPGTTVYLTRAAQPGAPGAERLYPIFRGRLGTDMTFVGFPATAVKLRAERWLVVFEQQPTEPRFALDASTTPGRQPSALQGWDQLAWGDLAGDAAGLQALTHVPLGGRLRDHRIGALQWGSNSGHMAAITLQRAFRVAIPITELVP